MSAEAKRRRYDNRDESFAARTEWRGECLEWVGYRNPKGYGRMSVNGRQAFSHRYAWERVNGPIPDGKFIDHTCHNRACANVEHLRLADITENCRNRAGAAVTSSTGVRNVYRRENGRYRVAFGVDKKMVIVGTYDTLEEAARVAEGRRLELFGDFAGGGR